jgi:hypothetical protein
MKFPTLPRLKVLEMELEGAVRLVDFPGFSVTFPEVKRVRMTGKMMYKVSYVLFPAGFWVPQVIEATFTPNTAERLLRGDFSSLKKLTLVFGSAGAINRLPRLFGLISSTVMDELTIEFGPGPNKRDSGTQAQGTKSIYVELVGQRPVKKTKQYSVFTK